jgi:hypothetical protein
VPSELEKGPHGRLVELSAERPGFGYLRIAVFLRREGAEVH